MSLLAFLGLNQIGPVEGLVLLALGLLLFGKRLPEVGRSLGKGIVEFKKGLKGIADEVEEQANRPPPPPAAKAELPRSAVNAPNDAFESTPLVNEDVRVRRGETID